MKTLYETAKAPVANRMAEFFRWLITLNGFKLNSPTIIWSSEFLTIFTAKILYNSFEIVVIIKPKSDRNTPNNWIEFYGIYSILSFGSDVKSWWTKFSTISILFIILTFPTLLFFFFNSRFCSKIHRSRNFAYGTQLNTSVILDYNTLQNWWRLAWRRNIFQINKAFPGS